MNLHLFLSMVAVVLGAETECGTEPKPEDLFSAIERDDMDEVSKLMNVVGINTYINSVTPLLYALGHEKIKMSEFLIANDNLIVDQGHADTGETPLLAAVRFEVYSCVPLLLRKGASIRATGLYNMNVLHYFALYGSGTEEDTKELLKVLLNNGADCKDVLDGRDVRKRTPLLTALGVENNFKPYLVEELIAAGCDVTAEDEYRSNALHYTGRHGREEIMSTLLNTKAKDLVNEYNKQKLTPLLDTLEHEGGKKLRVVEDLVKAGSDHKKYDREGNDALQIAVKNRRTRIVSYLLNLKLFDPCEKNCRGETAVTIAAINADGEMMKILLEEGKGSDKCVDEIDDKANMNTPLMRSLQVPECNLGVVEVLVNAGARLQIKDLQWNSILHYAAQNCEKEVVTFLLQKEVENEEKEKESDRAFVNDATDDKVESREMVKCRNEIGNTPLMSAMHAYFPKRERSKTLDVVKALVEYGSRVNATNSRSESALRYAVKNGYTDCALYLLEQKADAAVLDEDGNTLFHTGNVYLWTRDLVEALVKAGTPLNAWNNYRETPITDTLKRDLKYKNGRHFYTQESNALYEHILVAGADVNKPNGFDEVPLQIAVDHGHGGLVKLFLRYEAQTEVRNAEKDTPLLSVVKRKQLGDDDREVFQALMNANADLYAKDGNQRSAIDILSSASQVPEYAIQILQREKEKKKKKFHLFRRKK